MANNKPAAPSASVPNSAVKPAGSNSNDQASSVTPPASNIQKTAASANTQSTFRSPAPVQTQNQNPKSKPFVPAYQANAQNNAPAANTAPKTFAPQQSSNTRPPVVPQSATPVQKPPVVAPAKQTVFQQPSSTSSVPAAVTAQQASLPRPSMPPATTSKMPTGFNNAPAVKPSFPARPSAINTSSSGSLNSAALPPLASGVPAPVKQPIQTAPTTPVASMGAGGAVPPSPKPTPAAPTGPTPPPATAQYRRSPFRFLPFVIGGAIILLILAFIASKIFNRGGATPSTGTKTTGTSSSQTVLTYWGLWEPTQIFNEAISDFEQKNPTIKVNYQQQTYKDYRDRLQNAIVAGTGPDIFRFHASWTPMLANELAPLPESVMSATEFQQTFYPIATQQLSLNGKILGIPLEYDGLVLFYNDEALRTANLQPPKTWAEMKTAATQLTIRNGNVISRAGVALGNATNVEHFSDIIGLLMLQNGADPADPTSQSAVDAMDFYTRFATTDKVWDSSLPSSTVAFARGDVAMMIAPSWRVHDIKAQNPNLKFSIAPIPQLFGKKITWATYWAEGVNNQGKHQKEAWALLKYLSSAEALQKFYAAASKERTFGEIYPRQDLANTVANDPYVSPFLSDAPSASNWYLNSFTHDNGLNDQMIKYYEDAVNAIIGGQDVRATMQTVKQGSNQVLRTYGLAPAAAATTTTP